MNKISLSLFGLASITSLYQVHSLSIPSGCKGVAYEDDISRGAFPPDTCIQAGSDYSMFFECTDSSTLTMKQYSGSSSCDGDVESMTFTSTADLNGTTLVFDCSSETDCTVEEEYSYFLSTFTCDDGCDTYYMYMDDDNCDCADCSDETNWDCDSCGEDCPSSCDEDPATCGDGDDSSNFTYTTTSTSDRRLLSGFVKHKHFGSFNSKFDKRRKLAAAKKTASVKKNHFMKQPFSPKFHQRHLVTTSIVSDCSGTASESRSSPQLLDFCYYDEDDGESYMYSCDGSDLIWSNWTSTDCSGDADTSYTSDEMEEDCEVWGGSTGASQYSISHTCGGSEDAATHVYLNISMFTALIFTLTGIILS
jgi:hypothetical protein